MAPQVIVDFIFERGLLFVAVINIGDAPAHKVNVRFHQPLHGLNGTKDIAALAMFRNIEFLAPHKAIQTFLDSSQAYFERREPVQIKADITYVDGQGHTYGGVIEHDLEIYRDIVYLHWPGAGQETTLGGFFGPDVPPGGTGEPGTTPLTPGGPGSVLGSDVGPGSVLGSSSGPGGNPPHPDSPGISPARPGR